MGNSDFVVERTLRRDIRVPVCRIREVTPDNRVVLDLPSEEAEKLGSSPSAETDPTADFSENAEQEKEAWGLRKE